MKHIKLYEAFSDTMGSSLFSSAIKSALQNPEGNRPILLVSYPGKGTASMVSKEASSLGKALIYVDAPFMDAVDLRGIPQTRGTSTPDFLPIDNGPTDGGIILFNINRAESQVLNDIMRLAVHRRIGQYSLPDKWVVVVTSVGTPPEISFTSSLEDRFTIVEI